MRRRPGGECLRRRRSAPPAFHGGLQWVGVRRRRRGGRLCKGRARRGDAGSTSDGLRRRRRALRDATCAALPPPPAAAAGADPPPGSSRGIPSIPPAPAACSTRRALAASRLLSGPFCRWRNYAPGVLTRGLQPESGAPGTPRLGRAPAPARLLIAPRGAPRLGCPGARRRWGWARPLPEQFKRVRGPGWGWGLGNPRFSRPFSQVSPRAT